MPDSGEIGKMLSLGNDARLFDYIYDQVQDNPKVVDSMRADIMHICDMMKKADELFFSADVHAGQDPMTHYEARQDVISQTAISDLKEAGVDKQTSVLMLYKADNNGQLLRGYGVNDTFLNQNDANDKATMDKLDDAFKGWLKENGYSYKSSEVFLADRHGNLLEDDNGNPMKADMQEFEQKLRDPETGAGAYLQSQGLNIEVTDDLSKARKPEASAQAQEATADGTQQGMRENLAASRRSEADAEASVENDERPDGPGTSAGAGT